ncbi:amidase domain-containing protein [Streptomyces yanii]|uniref:Amidase domain-containing protein n=1 Tax=Streptomyces yanii TaxID=78510 RepID=A0ABV5R7X8_9ACTN
MPTPRPDGVHVVYQDRYNGTFSRAKQDNNCTNFASQAMNAGGWPIVGGVDPDNMDNWTYDLWGPRGPSKTWSMAYKLWMYASDSKRGTRLKDGSPAKADIWTSNPVTCCSPTGIHRRSRTARSTTPW